MSAATAVPRTLEGLSTACENVVYPHVFTCADREVGGFLVGRIRTDGSRRVTGALEARHTREHRADLTFTPETWSDAHEQIAARGRDEQIVGWYHSHPGFGIFLSEHDRFVHEGFFGGAGQIALVVDPLRRRQGVFGWRDGRLVVERETATPRRWQAPRTSTAGSPRARAASIAAHGALLVAAFLAGLVLWLSFGHGMPAPSATTPSTATPAPKQSKPSSQTSTTADSHADGAFR
jgi:proteasome lid subunit RPN8/RPN11